MPIRRTTLLVGAALALLIAVAYGPAAWSAQYVFDDGAAITGNPHVAWPPDLTAIFSGRYFGPAWRLGDFPSRPAVTLGFCLEQAVGLSSSPARHAVQLVLLLSICIVGYRLLRRWLAAAAHPAPQRTAGLAMALFAVHPVHVEAVMQVAYRPELQALLLLLLGTSELLALRLDGPSRSRAVRLALWTGLALLSKESSVAILALWGGWAILHPPSRQTLLRPVLWLLPICAIWAGWRRWNIGSLLAMSVPRHDNPLAWVDSSTRIRSSLELSARALQRLIVPADLAPDYTFAVWPPAERWTGLAVAGLLGLVLLGALSAWQWRRLALGTHTAEPAQLPAQLSAEGLILLPAGVLLTWLPVSHLLTPATVQFADRLLTTPALFAAVGAALVLGRLRPAGAYAAAALLLLPAVAQTAETAAAWSAPLPLFQRGVRLQPRSLRMRNNLAHEYVLRGRPDLALPEAQAALALDPDDPAVWSHGLDAALALKNCSVAEAFVARLEATTHPAPSARRAAVGWGMACHQFGRAFALARRLPVRALQQRDPLDIYMLAVAAGSPEADVWAHGFVADPSASPAWVSAAAFGEVQSARPLDALGRLATAQRAHPDWPSLGDQARAILQALEPVERQRALERWPALTSQP